MKTKPDSKALRKEALRSLANLLARRPYSEKELRQRLLKKFPPETAEYALAEAKKQRWLKPDDELALLFAQSLHEKNKGWLYIKSRLRQRGLPLPEYDRERERQKARALLAKKQIFLDGLSESQRRMVFGKARQLLQNRGFEEEIAKSLLSGFLD